MRSLAYRLFCVREERGLRHRCRGLCVAQHCKGLGGDGGGCVGRGTLLGSPQFPSSLSLFFCLQVWQFIR